VSNYVNSSNYGINESCNLNSNFEEKEICFFCKRKKDSEDILKKRKTFEQINNSNLYNSCNF